METLRRYDAVNKDLADRNAALENAEASLEGALRELLLAQDNVETSAKMALLGRLTAGIAHDLNTPLGAIRSSASLALEVETRRERDDIVVSFIDSGPGIPEKDRNKIFMPFFTTKRPGEGTGLGLDICKRIAERRGGSIGFESNPGRTRFWVRLAAFGAGKEMTSDERE
jgi:signal transduction histidine kinase